MATAVYIKTESCDDYLFCYEGNLTDSEIEEKLKEELDTEYEHVSEQLVEYS